MMESTAPCEGCININYGDKKCRIGNKYFTRFIQEEAGFGDKKSMSITGEKIPGKNALRFILSGEEVTPWVTTEPINVKSTGKG